MTYKNILLLLFFITAKSTPSHAFIDISQILSKMKAAHNIDVLHYDIQAKIITKDKTADFRTKISFIATEDAIPKVVFFIGSIFHIDSIEKDGHAQKFGVSSTGMLFTTVRVFLDTPLKKGEECLLAFHYTMKSEDLQYSSATMRDAFGEFDMFSGWYPIVYFEDTFMQDISVTVPHGQKVATNALLRKTISDSDFDTYIFKTGEPIFANFLDVGNFNMATKTYKGIRIEVYSDEDSKEFYESIIGDVKYVLEFYIEKIGQYPTTHYIIVLFPEPRAMAMGGLYTIKMGKSPLRWRSLFGVIAHETAHKWWANTVYPKYIVPYGFLAEGLAEYFSLLVLEKKFGFNEIRDAYDKTINVIKNRDIPISEVKFISGSEWMLFYYKSAYIFRMLHWIVGDKKFFEILKIYAQRHYHQWPEIKDFQSVAEEVYGKKLDWFFDPWLNTTKKLDLMVENVNVTQEKKNYNYSFTLKNIGDMNMPVDVEIELKGSKKEEIKKVSFSGTTQEVTLKTTFPATELLIDPHYWLFDFDRANNTVKLTQ